MRKRFCKDEESSIKESSESDRYTIDNLDLLNLRVSFSSDANNSFSQKGGRSKSQNISVSGRGDEYNRHPPRRLQSYKQSRTSDGDCSDGSRSRHHSGPSKSNDKSVNDLRDDEKSVLLLYSNKLQFKRDSLPKTASQEFLLSRHQKNQLSKSRTIEVYSRDVMENRASSKTRRSATPLTSVPEGNFPFKVTPSGNFKVQSQQVVFESEKLSVLVADPKHTKVNITDPMAHKREGDPSRDAAMDQIMSQGLGSSLGSLLVGRLADAPQRKEKESSEYEGKATNEILDPELNLNRLGYTATDAIDWNDVLLPEKKNLYLELYARITNFTNADCKVYIDNEEFNCHLIVLQCYSEVFHTYVAVKKVELPSDKCSAASFAFIYEWMITGDPSYRDLTRENVLDIFNAAKYLKIRDLIEQCWAFIDNPDVFSEDTAFLLYVDAKEKNLPEVRELMLPRIQKFFLMLVSSQDWLELDLEDVQNFLQSNYICVNCEMEVFMSAVRWLKHDLETRDQFKVAILSCVRFGNIAPWQLVDIKRNPDNPDFRELAKDVDICKMIDDGLAFVIIKYWYGQENEDYQHWNSILALKEPPARNWSGMDKTYFTYREFLIYLDQYRRNQMIEKSKPKDRKKKFVNDANTSPSTSAERLPPKVPTMDEFLTSRKGVTGNQPKKIGRFGFPSPQVVIPIPPLLHRRKIMTQDRAAVVIQRAFRRYLIHRMMKRNRPHVPKTKAKETEEKRIEFPWRTDQKVMSLFRKTDALSDNSQTPDPEPETEPKEMFCESSLFIYDRESVLVFGGIDPHNSYGVGRNTGKDIYRYLPDFNSWEFVGEIPEPRHHHCVGFLKGRVFLVGGADPRDEDSRGKSIVVDTMWSFDPIKRYWHSEPNLNIKRKNFGLVVGDRTLYAIGGQDFDGRTLSSVEKYSTITGTWERCSSMLYARMGVACTKFSEKIWAAGGMSGSKRQPLSNSVECYDIDKNQWTEVTKLRHPRCFGCMFAMSNNLYLIGGAGKMSSRDKTTTSLSSIDLWDEKRKEWEKISEMTIPRHGHAVAFLGTQILIIGGVTTIYMRALSNIECFCGNRGSWVRGIAPLPTYLSGHAAVTLPPGRLM